MLSEAGAAQSAVLAKSKDPAPARYCTNVEGRFYDAARLIRKLLVRPVPLYTNTRSFDYVDVRFANANFAQDDTA
jgi:hypothetical protein